MNCVEVWGNTFQTRMGVLWEGERQVHLRIPKKAQCGWNTMREGELAAPAISEWCSSQIMWGPVSLSRSWVAIQWKNWSRRKTQLDLCCGKITLVVLVRSRLQKDPTGSRQTILLAICRDECGLGQVLGSVTLEYTLKGSWGNWSVHWMLGTWEHQKRKMRSEIKVGS